MHSLGFMNSANYRPRISTHHEPTEANAPAVNEQQSQSYDPPAEGQNRGIVSTIGSTLAAWTDIEMFENMFS